MEATYQPGDIIQENYQIVGVLGAGGTAITYEALDLTQSMPVAIKVLSLQKTQDWKLVELFEREARVLKNLDHPKIPQYLDYFSIDTQSDRQFLLVQELIPGKSLADLVEQGWYFDELEVKNITQQILEILNFLHNLHPPIIHRDIKPHNIIRTDDNEIYLVDLGAVQDVYRNTLTRGATFVGTIDYMSPEQLRGHASFASDLYSLGCTLLYLLTRRSPAELPLARMKIDFRSSLNLDEQFASWLETALEPALEDRFNSTAQALEKLHQQKVTAKTSLDGSNIKISQKANRLIINIPPQKKLFAPAIRNTIVDLTIGAIATFMLSFPSGFLLDSVIRQFNLAALVTSLVVWMIFASSSLFLVTKIFSLLFLFFGKIRLEMNKEQFKFSWNCLGVKFKQMGYTGSIQAVTIAAKIKRESFFNPPEHCVIYGGVKEYKFGIWLTKGERRWLVTEIANFVIEQYPMKDKDGWLKNIWNYY
ncbi:MAG: serine/threonine-protein kinase [Cyanobacteria bacterium J06600_6]